MSRARLAAPLAAALLASGAPGAQALPPDRLTPFSETVAGGPLPAAWRRLQLPGVAAPVFRIVADGAGTVLESRAANAAGTVAHALAVSPEQRPILAWRWKVDRVVAGADLTRKEGDDFAARVYVFFDVPLDSLPLADRARALVARAFWGQELPTAALCYVWDNRHPPGTSRWNPYTERVRTVVLRSAPAGAWAGEERDLEADFRAAFGAQWSGPVPRVTGVAVGNDTDQTGETVTAWFGDLELRPRR